MTIRVVWAVAVGVAVASSVPAADPPRKDAPPPPAGFPKFQVQEIASDLKIGYAVIVVDINGDTKPDIVVVDQHRVVWYENPTWKMRTILQGKTKPDNVCICALDIDGGGDLELVLGAGWRPTDTKTPGTLQWLKRGKSQDEEWTLHPIPCDEPTVHRVKVGDLDGDGKPEIVMAPLQGRECTAKGNWTDGRPVRILAYKVPVEPTRPEAWKPEVISDELHVVHNFALPATRRMYKNGERAEYELFTASYEGVTHYVPDGPPGRRVRPGELQRSRGGDQSNPKANRGSSEVTATRVKTWPDYNWVATIEPWHGNKVVFYTKRTAGETGTSPPGGGMTRAVLDDRLRWGHAVTFADLNGDDVPELVVGVRDDPNPKAGDTFKDRRGVRIYRNTDGKGEKWDRYILEDGGVAVEDLAVADLNGDGKPDIVAVGRQTGNCRIYWNQGK